MLHFTTLAETLEPQRLCPMRKFPVLFIASLTFGCFEPTDPTPADGTESNAGSETMAGTTHSASTTADSTTADSTTSPDDAGTSNTDSADPGADTTTTEGGKDTGESGTETGTPLMGCHGRPTPCETFGVGEHDACVDADGCTPVIACAGTPNTCAQTPGCPGLGQDCNANCEARPGCSPVGPILCPGTTTNPQCYTCQGTPDPCEDVDEAGGCVLSGCVWGHQDCEGTPAACESYDAQADCEDQSGCDWLE
jgi:hypothetical protein